MSRTYARLLRDRPTDREAGAQLHVGRTRSCTALIRGLRRPVPVGSTGVGKPLQYLRTRGEPASPPVMRCRSATQRLDAGVHELVEQAGGQEHRGHPLGAQELAQLRRRQDHPTATTSVAPLAAHPRSPTPCRVEVTRRDLTKTRRPHLEEAGLPRDGPPPVRDRHALRPPGRPRRVHHIRQIRPSHRGRGSASRQVGRPEPAPRRAGRPSPTARRRPAPSPATDPESAGQHRRGVRRA